MKIDVIDFCRSHMMNVELAYVASFALISSTYEVYISSISPSRTPIFDEKIFSSSSVGDADMVYDCFSK